MNSLGTLSNSTMPAPPPRLDEDDAIALAVVVEENPDVLGDPRLQNALLLAIYAAPGQRVLLAWPDGCIGFVWLKAGVPLGHAVLDGYRTARDFLEATHLQHAAPAGATH